MFEIGNSLREARLRQQLQFAVLEERTKVRPKYLRALEDEQFEVLPAPTYVKGFLKAYADALGLDGQLYVDEFNSRFVAGEEDAPFRAQRTPSTRAARRVETSAVLVTLAAVIAVTALLVLAFKSPDANRRHAVGAKGATPVQPAPHPVVRKRPAPRVSLVLTAAVGDSWLEVRAGSSSGDILFSGTLPQGKSLPFTGRRLWVSAGALQNLRAKVNGAIASLVGSGSPATLVFGPHGQLTG
jgi:cytoskeleton protein RodZ